jgi:hypothetical protein
VWICEERERERVDEDRISPTRVDNGAFATRSPTWVDDGRSAIVAGPLGASGQMWERPSDDGAVDVGRAARRGLFGGGCRQGEVSFCVEEKERRRWLLLGEKRDLVLGFVCWPLLWGEFLKDGLRPISHNDLACCVAHTPQSQLVR